MENRIFLGEKYADEFLSKNDKKFKPYINKIVLKEKEYKWSCVSWTLEMLKDYLRSIKSISPNSISEEFSSFKKYVKFICKEEKLEYTEIELDCDISDLVDYEKILSITLSPDELKCILDQLGENTRIKAIIGLASNLITPQEISNLKEEDIEFKNGDLGIEVAVIKTKDRCVTIEDPDVIKDIKKCIGQTQYYMYSKYPSTEEIRKKAINLKETKYLIKPTKSGPGAKTEDKDAQIGNPSLTLQKALKQHKIECPGIDVNALSIEDIKRSKIIYMLANQDFFSKEEIIEMLGGGNKESYLAWLEKVVVKKYNLTINYRKKKGEKDNNFGNRADFTRFS